MDAKDLRELIDMISRSNFSTFELEREGFKLKLVKSGPAPLAVSPAPVAESRGASLAAATEVAAVPLPAAGRPAVEDGLAEVNSPIVGTFYEAPSPGAPPFVAVGDRVRKGQVLCIVEAMKLMNEIESEIDAEVVEIVAVNGRPVEFGETLFRLRPLS